VPCLGTRLVPVWISTSSAVLSVPETKSDSRAKRVPQEIFLKKIYIASVMFVRDRPKSLLNPSRRDSVLMFVLASLTLRSAARLDAGGEVAVVGG